MAHISSNGCAHHFVEERIVGNMVKFFQKIIHGFSLVFSPYARGIARNNRMCCSNGEEEK